jgi:hypothetical protein
LDAEKNSISMLAQSKFSHKVLQNKNGKEKKEMLENANVSWNDLPIEFQRGIYFKKTTLIKKFTPDEINILPEKHLARINPDLLFKRSNIEEIKLPRLIEVDDRVNLLFGISLTKNNFVYNPSIINGDR